MDIIHSIARNTVEYTTVDSILPITKEIKLSDIIIYRGGGEFKLVPDI